MRIETSPQALTNRNIANATKWSFFAEFSAKMIVPVTNMILARILAPEVFGLVALVNMVISFTDMITTAGFQKYLIQHEYENEKDLSRGTSVAFWTNFVLSILLWGLIVLFNGPIAVLVGSVGYGLLFVVAGVSLPITALSSVQETIFIRDLSFKKLFYNRMIYSFLPFVITIPLALLGFGYWSLIIGSIFGNVAKAVFLTANSRWKPNFYYSFRLMKTMLSFSLWSLIEAFTIWVSIWADIFIISNALGSYYTGLYRTAQITVTGIISVITASTTSVLFSSLSRVQNDHKKFTQMLFLFQRHVGMLVLPLGVGIFIFRDTVTSIILGSKWIEASSFIGIWGLCTALVATYGTFCREAYRAKGMPKVSVFAQVLHLSFVIPVCILSIPYGFDFLIYSRSIASLGIILVHFLFLKIFVKISPLSLIKQTIIPIAGAVMMGCIGMIMKTYITGNMTGLISIALCAIFYFSFLWLFPSYRGIFKMTFSKAANQIKNSPPS